MFQSLCGKSGPRAKLILQKFSQIKNRANFYKRTGETEILVKSDQPPSNAKILIKATTFTVAVTGVSFVGASIWQYENVRTLYNKGHKNLYKWWNSSNQPKYGEWRGQLQVWWSQLSEGQKLFWPICFINGLVFLAWRIPKFTPTMMKYFGSSIGSKAVCLPMLLSAFSHPGGFHLLCNMFVLHSFSTEAVRLLGREQFLGVYISACVVSSLPSYVFRVLTKSTVLSVGASGAILTILAIVCTERPETQIRFFFLPWFTLFAGDAIKGIVAFDTAGLVLKWKLFDHAAHLGGTLFGVAYVWWLHKYLWDKREHILKFYHQLRDSRPPPGK